LSPQASSSNSHPPEDQQSLAAKVPQTIFSSIFAFAPNRDTLGGTAYLIVGNNANILIDCPILNQVNQDFLRQQGGVRSLVLTHRGGIGQVSQIQQTLECQVLIQEQEAYLLPDIEVTTFHDQVNLTPETQLIWTPGHSPGSACLYYRAFGGVLFSGRHLLPNQQGQPVPLRTAKTFHWPRQLQSVQRLIDRFTLETLNFICPGANTGFLRGRRVIERAYEQLCQLDLAAYRHSTPTF
jgi:glyoxylase-like metal-dependent hydrolase (beta-lactamase superfamily II)